MSAYASDHQSPAIDDHACDFAQACESESESESFDPQRDVVERLQNVGEQVREFVQERPLTAIGIAVTAGFLVARVLSR